ncbi:uncharacterized protein LOC144769198 [Lissotriton helveticus]
MKPRKILVNFLTYTLKKKILNLALNAKSLKGPDFQFDIRSDLSKTTLDRQWEWAKDGKIQSLGCDEPRGKQNTGTESAGEPPVTQSSSTEDPAAVPSAEPLPSTSADGDSGAASAIPAGTGGTEAPTPAAVGGEPTAAGDVTPSQKPTRKELAVRARQRKLQAIVEAYRRLVDQAEEEEEEAAAAAAASSNAPGPKPAGLRRRGQAAARRRIVTSSAAPPQQQQHACKCRCRDFKAKILRRVAKLEEERKKLEDGLEERVKIMVDKHLKARRL